ncbi:S-layer homology domain-containing protein [Fusibacter ferrireducens]|uniref:S-layer homology domain-containing protein n=1 Tax=Fusibacter ferrireducens TaxID=2785058 RepID=A0ABR9ZXJ9_9FIRM|nr:S-layer homology domain-containing protein [Fusibacter ferrireducens]MBF4695177.1 S-layer homology domain-containing protein [Fusibacter ferrireducens]
MKRILMQIMLSLLIIFQTIGIAYTEVKDKSGADLLLRYGFITGINGDAMVNKIITRAQVAVIMAELHGDKETAANFPLPSGFSDVPEGIWYTPYIAYGKVYGYLGGYPDGTFKPNEPVNAQEFAAFMMNAMGYSGEYHYDQVIQFAQNKNVIVRAKGTIFLRGDAFEALWDVVNQPAKGSNITIGMALGKLDRAYTDSEINLGDEENPVEAHTLEKYDETVFKVVPSGKYTVEIQFNEIVTDYERISFILKEYMLEVPVDLITRTTWNDSKTVATLTTYWPLEVANYEVVINDARGDQPIVVGTYKLRVEKEKIGKIELDSKVITMIDDYTGTINYKAYNQYGDDVTAMPLGKTLYITVSTSKSTPEVDYSKGLIVIQHGSADSEGVSLKDLPKVTILIGEPMSGFVFSTELVTPAFD